MVKGFRDTIDSLLVFAALFSAVVTTFVVETRRSLQTDYSQISSLLMLEQIQLLRANGNVTAINAVPSSLLGPTLTSSDVWVNGLFFTSLSLSLSTALLSVLVKQWVQAYTIVSSGNAKSRANVRQFRYSGVMRWKLPAIIGLLPFLLHASLAMFLIGLAVHVRSLHPSLSWSVIGISTIAFVFYFGSMILPAVQIDCPYRIPVLFLPTRYAIYPLSCFIHLMIFFYRRCWQKQWYQRFEWPKLQTLSLKYAELDAIGSSHRDQVISEAVLWLHEVSSNITVSRVATKAITGLPKSFLSSLARSQIADAVWRHLHAYKESSREYERYPDVWIPAMKWLAQDSFHKEKLDNELIAQARNGHRETVAGLLECGADVNAQGSFYGNALQAASAWGQLELVKFLIDSGADVNAQGGYYGNALQAASFIGSPEIVHALLESGADLHARGGVYENALQAADGERRMVVMLDEETKRYNDVIALLRRHAHVENRTTK